MFSDQLIGRNVRDYHLIVTSHPYMIELGLGTSTTGTLYHWWNQQNNAGTYLNRMAINNTRNPFFLETPSKNLGDLLGLKSGSDGTEFFWNGWKPNKELQNAGRYKKQDLSEYLGGFGSDIGGGNAWSYDSAVGPVYANNTFASDYSKPVIGGTLDGDLNFQPEFGSVNATITSSLSPIYDIVNLNRYMSSFTDYNPRSLWDKDDSTIAGKGTKSLYASHELLTEIKSSKTGPYIEWSGEVTFYTNDGGFFCPITEWVPFKLYLFDSPHSNISDKTVTIKSLKYAAPKRDVTGRLFNSRVDGGHTSHNPSDSSSYGVGDLDLHTNPVSNKWESGSPVLFAVMCTAVGYPTVPSIDHLETNNVEEDLDSDDYETTKFIPASGTAMPIRPQNGNPLQWQPNYLRPDDIRCADEENPDYDKETLQVYNFSTQRKFNRGDTVMLTRIDNVWHVSAMGTNDGDADTVIGSVEKWGEFTYMMTNSDYFFKNAEGASFTPRDAEQYLHSLYYADDDLNYGDAGVNYGQDGGWDQNQTFNTTNIVNVELKHGYAQTTSFDYLDSTIFGIRQKAGVGGNDFADACSIATTDAKFTSGGVSIPSPKADFNARNAAHAGVFFGCIFPGGYKGVSEYTTPRGWDVKVKSSGEIAPTGSYVDTTGPNNAINIFDAGNLKSDRNNCRNPVVNDPFDAIDPNGGGNKWARNNEDHSANLFAKDGKFGTTVFSSVPADVMTNASPAGANGSPLYPVHRFKDMHKQKPVIAPIDNRTSTAEDVKLLAGQAFLQGIWLGKEAEAGGSIAYDESAFDFAPISRNTLMFRPLKMEAYIQFGENNNSPNTQTAQNLSKTTSRTRVGFCSEARRTQIDWNRPATAFFEDRERVEADTDLWSKDGLRWGGDVQNSPSYQNLHEFDYWDRSGRGPLVWTNGVTSLGGGNWKGAGAFGVITTFNTVKANSQIDITTENIYGMGAGSHGKFSLSTGRKQDRTWGVTGFRDSYKQENIIDLSLRVYQQHPRNQTLYDPRTFAVHHFNPDVRLRGGYFLKDNGQLELLSPFRPELVQEDIREGADIDGDPVEYSYKYEDTLSEVDIRVISRYQKELDHTIDDITAEELHESGSSYTAIKLKAGEYVCSDSTVASDGTRQPPVINSKFWRIDGVRVGKLLPFRYNTLEVGIPVAEGDSFFVNNDSKTISHTGLDKTAKDLRNLMVIKSLGTGYKTDDIVGLNSRGVQFKVTVLLGVIVSLECVSRGTGITASQTAPIDKSFKEGDDGPLEITTIKSVDGTGFEAYYVAGQVYEKLNTDPKPYLMKRDGEEIIRIAADVSQGTHETAGHTDVAEEGAFVEESRETTFILDPTLYSDNKQYDLFFHFHNDISMTWMSSKEGFFGSSAGTEIAPNLTDANEQHITVRINPR